MDAYLAGWLILENFIHELRIECNGKVIFCFPSTPELQKALTKYNNGAPVEALKFALAVKNLKGQVFELKKENVNHGTTFR